MKLFTTIVIALMTFGATAQSDMKIEVKNTTNKCLSIDISSEDNGDILLRSQNYRLFYDNAATTFQDVKVSDKLKRSNFTADVAIHRTGLAKNINGKIPFESNMGFLGLNLTPEDDRADFVYMTAENTLKVADVCFDSEIDASNVILTERGITDMYVAVYSVIDFEEAGSEAFTIDLGMLEAEEVEEPRK